jgi:hypothetical protein
MSADDGGCKHVWNTDPLLWDYTAQYPRRHHLQYVTVRNTEMKFFLNIIQNDMTCSILREVCLLNTCALPPVDCNVAKHWCRQQDNSSTHHGYHHVNIPIELRSSWWTLWVMWRWNSCCKQKQHVYIIKVNHSHYTPWMCRGRGGIAPTHTWPWH